MKKQWIQVAYTILGLTILSGCGGNTDDKKKRLATFSELSVDFGCAGLTNDGKNLICGTGGGEIISIDPYTGAAKSIYELKRSLNALAYLGNDRYVFKENSYEGVGIVYTFDIHEKLQDTLDNIDYMNSAGFVYDQKRKMLFVSSQNGIEARDLDANSLAGGQNRIEESAMAQTADYIYVTGYDTYIEQFSKNNILNNRGTPGNKRVVLDFNKGYFSGTPWGISGMTILHGEIFIYFRGDGKIHKLNVNLADYGDGGPHF